MGISIMIGVILILSAITLGLVSLLSFVPRKDKYTIRVLAISLTTASIIALRWSEFVGSPIHFLSLFGTYIIWLGSMEFSKDRINAKALIVGSVLGTWCGVIALMEGIGWSVMFTPILAGLLSVTLILLPAIRKK